MNKLSIDHFAVASALLLHGVLFMTGGFREPVRPETEQRIVVRLASIETETTPSLAPLQEMRQQKTEPRPVRDENTSNRAPEPVRRQEQRPAPPPTPVPAPQAPVEPVPQAAPAPRQAPTATATPARGVRQAALPAVAQATASDASAGAQRSEVAAVTKPSARLADYLTLVRGMVENNREYPATARQLGLQGTVTVRVSIRRDGSIVEARIAESAGHRSLDKAALNAVRRAAPFRHPGGFGLEEVTVEIPIVYRLT